MVEKQTVQLVTYNNYVVSFQSAIIMAPTSNIINSKTRHKQRNMRRKTLLFTYSVNSMLFLISLSLVILRKCYQQNIGEILRSRYTCLVAKLTIWRVTVSWFKNYILRSRNNAIFNKILKMLWAEGTLGHIRYLEPYILLFWWN